MICIHLSMHGYKLMGYTQLIHNKQVAKKFSKWKPAHVGMEPQKTKLDGNDITTLSHQPYILCHFATDCFVCSLVVYKVLCVFVSKILLLLNMKWAMLSSLFTILVHMNRLSACTEFRGVHGKGCRDGVKVLWCHLFWLFFGFHSCVLVFIVTCSCIFFDSYVFCLVL